MTIQVLTKDDALWLPLADFADACSWAAGPVIAKKMRANALLPWERVFAAVEDGRFAGFCNVSAHDCLPDAPYTPYIGDVFVDEAYRGRRISEQMIRAALAYMKTLGYDKVYLVSDHVGLYEKYGFVKVDEVPAPWDAARMQTIFVQEI